MFAAMNFVQKSTIFAKIAPKLILMMGIKTMKAQNKKNIIRQMPLAIRWATCGFLLAGLSACVQQPTAPVVKKPQPVKVITKSTQSHHSVPASTTIWHDDTHGAHDYHSHDVPRMVGTKADFDAWLKAHPYHRSAVNEYVSYLSSQVGKDNLPPIHELLTTARSWQECGHEPYEVPPRDLWQAMIPTIRLYRDLQQAQILPKNTHIRSVYRNPDLNRCAGGAASSKHMSNGAIDIWVPSFEVGSSELTQLQNKLCEYWLFNGATHHFGLGLYATGAIHLDTQGYRKWGAQFSERQSICRYTPPKSSELLP